MDNKTKDSYLVSTGFVFVGIILIYGSGLKLDITLYIGIISTALGLAGFKWPKVAEILLHWAKKQKKEAIRQQQQKPINSPQTGIVHGNMTNIYGTQTENKKLKKNSINKSKIKKRLNEIKLELENLKKLGCKEGHSNLSALKIETKGIIHKIYKNDSSSAEKRLIQKVFWMISKDTPDSAFQEWYIEDINNYITTINVINREMDL